MKALVTGGLGFIGSHLVDRLLSDAWEVVVLDYSLPGHRSNIAHQKDNPRLAMLEGDVRDIAEVKKSFAWLRRSLPPRGARTYESEPN